MRSSAIVGAVGFFFLAGYGLTALAFVSDSLLMVLDLSLGGAIVTVAGAVAAVCAAVGCFGMRSATGVVAGIGGVAIAAAMLLPLLGRVGDDDYLPLLGTYVLTGVGFGIMGLGTRKHMGALGGASAAAWFGYATFTVMALLAVIASINARGSGAGKALLVVSWVLWVAAALTSGLGLIKAARR
ncbi:MAG: hypothetical protein HY908_06980 [Myxococcales bacterium]|nr:hypothetical protein [Myxococcales bacterium]